MPTLSTLLANPLDLTLQLPEYRDMEVSSVSFVIKTYLIDKFSLPKQKFAVVKVSELDFIRECHIYGWIRGDNAFPIYPANINSVYSYVCKEYSLLRDYVQSQTYNNYRIIDFDANDLPKCVSERMLNLVWILSD